MILIHSRWDSGICKMCGLAVLYSKLFYQKESTSVLKQVSAGLCLVNHEHSKQWWPWFLLSFAVCWEGPSCCWQCSQWGAPQAASWVWEDVLQVVETSFASVSLGYENSSFSVNIRVRNILTTQMESVTFQLVALSNILFVPYLSIQLCRLLLVYFLFHLCSLYYYNIIVQWCPFVHLFLFLSSLKDLAGRQACSFFPWLVSMLPDSHNKLLGVW